MYFLLTLVCGWILLSVEIATVVHLNGQLTIELFKKIRIWFYLIFFGMFSGMYFCTFEYSIPIIFDEEIAIYGFPVMFGANSGGLDIWGIFTIPVLVFDFVVGLLFPQLVFAAYVECSKKIKGEGRA